ncbi:hypothetical protein [Vreelandella utahensis]|uniref:hypothetical protein n=1 Tax=Vreelandella halophila TaxID=86177 RepID=UPI000985AB02|nr:hypothetical protein [Halomonas utahensis]
MSPAGANRNRRSLWTIFAAPTWIALASLIGLASALMGEGVWNLMAWAGVGVPVLAAVFALRYRTH